jgi:tRNA-Thr(GGU) m(6)t(6)A37 methyltransferase TsaA
MTIHIAVEPIGYVSSTRAAVVDDGWDEEASSIQLLPAFGPDSLAGLGDFSHIEVLFHFHKIDAIRVVTGARHPRGNAAWPLTGIFAQRAKDRPNRLGTTICRLLRIEGGRLQVSGLDAIDGTPVLDLKPVMREFLPRGAVVQPAWSHELMQGYWGAEA